MIAHNVEDDNVLFQNTVQMIDALERAGKAFEMQVYTQKTHAVTGAEALQLNAAMVDFFERNLKLHPEQIRPCWQASQAIESARVPLKLPLVLVAAAGDIGVGLEVDDHPGAVLDKRQIDDAFHEPSVVHTQHDGIFAMLALGAHARDREADERERLPRGSRQLLFLLAVLRQCAR